MEDFTLTLEGDGITVKRSVDRATALEILNSVLAPRTHQDGPMPPAGSNVEPDEKAIHRPPSRGLPPAVAPQRSYPPPPPPPPQMPAPPPEKPLSLREYVNEFEPKTNAQIILCIAQFLAMHESLDRFKRDQIKPKFPAAGEAPPKNYARDFQTAIDKGWIGSDPMDKSLFFVTRTGEQQLKTGFKGKRN